MGKFINAPITKRLSESQLHSSTNPTLTENDINGGSGELSYNDDNNQTLQSNGNDSTNSQSGHFL